VATPQALYQIVLYDPSGNQTAVITDWQALTYTRTVNAPGGYTLTFGGDSMANSTFPALAGLFTEDAIVQVRRRLGDLSQPWYTDLTAFHADDMMGRDESGLLYFGSAGVGTLDLLNRRTIAYKAGTKYVEKYGAAGEVIGEFVEENAGASATTGLGREASGVTAGLTITAPAIGSTWEGQRHQQNLLNVIQGISVDVADVEFEMVTTAGGGSVAHAFGVVARIGTDRSSIPAAVVFSTRRGNMAAPDYSNARRESRNRVFVLGPGEKADRYVITVDNSAAQAGSPWALREVAREATQESTGDGLTNVGARVLEASKPRESFTFTPIETETSRYGLHYQLGDTVIAVKEDGSEETLRIIGVTITINGGQSGAEVISLDVSVLD
jgi:hypothetical protein